MNKRLKTNQTDFVKLNITRYHSCVVQFKLTYSMLDLCDQYEYYWYIHRYEQFYLNLIMEILVMMRFHYSCQLLNCCEQFHEIIFDGNPKDDIAQLELVLSNNTSNCGWFNKILDDGKQDDAELGQSFIFSDNEICLNIFTK